MVLIVDGNSEIGAHVLSDLGYLICLDLERSQIWTFFANTDFLHMCAMGTELPSYYKYHAFKPVPLKKQFV